MFAFSIGVPSNSAIPDYPTLKSTIADWLDRDDLDSKIPFFVQMAEAMFNRELRTREMEATTLITTSIERTDLPADYLEMRAIYILGSPDRPLRATVPTAVRQEYDGTPAAPDAYTMVGGGLVLIPPPDSPVNLHLDYFARIEGLTDANEANWLLDKHPDLYWSAAIAYAYDYLDDDAKSQKYFGYTTTLIDRINRSAQNDRFGPAPMARFTCPQTTGARC